MGFPCSRIVKVGESSQWADDVSSDVEKSTKTFKESLIKHSRILSLSIGEFGEGNTKKNAIGKRKFNSSC